MTSTWPNMGKDPHTKRARPRHAQSGVARALQHPTGQNVTRHIKSDRGRNAQQDAGSHAQGTATQKMQNKPTTTQSPFPVGTKMATLHTHGTMYIKTTNYTKTFTASKQ